MPKDKLNSMEVFKFILSVIFIFHSFLGYAQTEGSFVSVPGSPFPAGNDPTSVAFSPVLNGKLFAAVANEFAHNISVYSVNTSDGTLTQVSGSPFPAGTTTSSIAYSPVIGSNLFAAVTDQGANTISVYSVDQSTGAFTQVSGSPFSTGNGPYSVSYSPIVNGNLFAAVANSDNNSVSIYSVNPINGEFTQILESPSPTGSQPLFVTYSPIVDGHLFAAVANNADSSISVYNVDMATGAFTPLPDSPFLTRSAPFSVAYSPVVDGNLFAAVPNNNHNTVSAYSIALPPTVTEITPSEGPISGGTNVTIIGTKFNNVTDVLFGTTPAFFIPISETEIIATSPAGSGTVDVTVMAEAGTSATSLNDQFTYLPPIVTGVSPSLGPTEGGTQVIIMGAGFTDATRVLFGKIPAFFMFESDTRIIASSPPGRGIVDITVEVTGESSAISPADKFIYSGPPQSPTDAKGCQKVKKCGKGKCGINVLTWKAPSDDALIIKYNIYKDKSLCNLVGSVIKNNPLKFKDSSKIGKSKTYYIVSVNTFKETSKPVKVKVHSFCRN